MQETWKQVSFKKFIGMSLKMESCVCFSSLACLCGQEGAGQRGGQETRIQLPGCRGLDLPFVACELDLSVPHSPYL